MENVKGKMNTTNTWKERRKKFPRKTKIIPTGVKNIKGKVITNPDEKKKITLELFQHRMIKRDAKDEIKEQVEENRKLFETRRKAAKQKKSPLFNMIELELVLKIIV